MKSGAAKPIKRPARKRFWCDIYVPFFFLLLLYGQGLNYFRPYFITARTAVKMKNIRRAYNPRSRTRSLGRTHPNVVLYYFFSAAYLRGGNRPPPLLTNFFFGTIFFLAILNLHTLFLCGTTAVKDFRFRAKLIRIGVNAQFLLSSRQNRDHFRTKNVPRFDNFEPVDDKYVFGSCLYYNTMRLKGGAIDPKKYRARPTGAQKGHFWRDR